MSQNTATALKKLMDNHNLNANQLANRTGGNGATIGRILKGTTKPSEKTLLKLSEYFKVPLDYLITGNEKYLNIDSTDLVEGDIPQYNSIKSTNKKADKISKKELNRFLEILFLHKEDYENTEMYQVFEQNIRIDERKKTIKEILTKKMNL